MLEHRDHCYSLVTWQFLEDTDQVWCTVISPLSFFFMFSFVGHSSCLVLDWVTVKVFNLHYVCLMKQSSANFSTMAVIFLCHC
jgi:hypothetical protein